MEKIKIINWNKDLCDKKAKEYEDYTNNKNNISFNFTKEEQKHYWLTIFLPSIIAFAAFVTLFVLAAHISNDFAKWVIRIGLVFATGIYLAIKWFDIVKDYILPLIEEEKTCDTGIKFHKAVAGKEIVDLICIDGFPINDSKCVSKPVMLMLKDEQGNESSYEFKPNEWEFAATNKEIPVVDVEGGIVFCPEQSSYRGADDSCT